MIITRAMSKLSTSHKQYPKYEDVLPEFKIQQVISHNIFQICLQSPINVNHAEVALRNKNPEWHYQMFRDQEAETMILDNYGEVVLSYYKRINPIYGAARADFLRYLLLYRFGGVYIDLKCGLNRSLDQSIVKDAFPVFFWDDKPRGNHHPAIPEYIKEGEILQGFIVSPAGHPYLRAVIIETMKRIDSYNPYVDGIGYGGVMKVTGPGMYTETIYRCFQNMPEYGYVAKPFQDFGFVHRAVYADTIPHMTDYRVQTEPLICTGSRALDSINKVYLRFLVRRRHNHDS